MFLLICLNLLKDFIPKTIGKNAACKWANNKIEKNKINSKIQFIKNLDTQIVSSYLSKERYHFPITTINIVRTKGKAGYLV